MPKYATLALSAVRVGRGDAVGVRLNIMKRRAALLETLSQFGYYPCKTLKDVSKLHGYLPSQELVCLDEIQCLPEFFVVLRSEIDRDRRPGRFLILGSASRELIQQSSESLAGRIAYLRLTPFLRSETRQVADWQTLWVRGGFPDSLLSGDSEDSFAWRQDFIQTFLERDIPALGLTLPVPVVQRLWQMLAHYHGQPINYSKLAGAVDVSVPTLKKYLAVLEQRAAKHLAHHLAVLILIN